MTARSTPPSVGVIIPTKGRPQLLERAIRSVLAQTYTDFQIIVVIDGPDLLTDSSALEAMDSRISVLSLIVNVGLAEARNRGIRFTKAKWIALLDDDDEWLPKKLCLQVKRALELGGDHVFVPCRFIEKTAKMERVMPIQLPTDASHFSEYIYCHHGYLQPSMFFISRKLCLDVPFTPGLRFIEDSDWLLRATRHRSIRIGSVDEPLSIYYNVNDGKRESEMTPWRIPLNWAIHNRRLFTRRAFPAFIARIGMNASQAGEPFTVFLFLLRTATQYGDLNFKTFSYFAICWFVPRHQMRQMLGVAIRAERFFRSLFSAPSETAKAQRASLSTTDRS
jgi:glycosyltransferase involved in cell wall biosynthesis